jgi:hypothetical protein
MFVCAVAVMQCMTSKNQLNMRAAIPFALIAVIVLFPA